MKAFKRRFYRSLGEVLTDFCAIWSRRDLVREAMNGAGLDPAFRERLMLVVTGVNGCRYCSYAHAWEALAEGITQDEIDALEAGMFEGSPSEEVPALLYAQHWAETDGEPDPAVRERIERRYGARMLERIEMEYLEYHLHLVLAYYHFVLYHSSLRERLPEPIPTRGDGSPKIWRQQTPAMSARLTDHQWTMEELLMYQVPAGP